MTPEMKISLVALLVFVICVLIILRPKSGRRKPGQNGARTHDVGLDASHSNRDNDHGGGFDGDGGGGGGD